MMYARIARNCCIRRLRENCRRVSNAGMKFPVRPALALLLALNAFSLRAADDPFAWPPITAQTKPWAFNWWMGSAVDKTNLTKELERYAAAGLGGIHIIPIYGAKGFEDKYINYLSPQWMEMMGWAVSEAHRLGMGVDMTTGTGWCFGGPQVTDEDANASVIVKTFEVKAGEKLTQKFNRAVTQALVACGPNGKVIELTDKISADGSVDFVAPPVSLAPIGGEGRGEGAAWTIYAISQKPSGQKVKRPAPGGEGWMLNLIYPSAMDDFLKPYTAAFASYTGPKPRAQYHDSYEYKSDWSPDFFAQFEKRRGYKLQLELPALLATPKQSEGGFGTKDEDHANRVKCDYRQTVSELMAESLTKWTDWSHAHGFITRNQAHGSPGNWLDLYACADIPETEMFHTDKNKLISKFASSAAHVTGKNLVSSETGTWLEEHFTEKLSDVKYLFDDMFLSGINHMFYHGCCYSPDEAGWPGWHFYASLEMNPRNSVWRDAGAVNAYAARVQSVLQSGQPDNDILLYWNTGDFWMQPGDKMLPQLTVHARDWFEGQPVGKTAKELWDKGYAFDYVSDAQLKTAKVAAGKIQMPGGDYKVIVVPECKYMPLETFKQLLALADKGATVIFEKYLPVDISGENNLAAQREEFKNMNSQLIANENRRQGTAAYQVGAGHLWSGNLTNILKIESSKIAPENLNGLGLSFVRRSFDGGWNYFIANRTDKNFDGWITLARHAKDTVILDPMTGHSGAVMRNENSQIHLQLAAGQSVIVRAFETPFVPDRISVAWTYWQTNGQPVAISGDWKIKFLEGGPVLPADFSAAKLASWTTFSDTNCQAFAGTAKYETTFDAPNSASKNFELNLGDVRQSARVKLNGKDFGTLITPPFRVVVDNLQPTGNKLEVEVTSVAANRIRDLDRRGVKWKTFRDINIVDINYKSFDASNWPLTDCGLLGPVTLTPVKAE
jgi:alpha-L-rhamnosidase